MIIIHSYSKKTGGNTLWKVFPLLFINTSVCTASVIMEKCVIRGKCHKTNGTLTESISSICVTVFGVSVYLVCQRSLCGVACIIGGSGFIMGPSLWELAHCQQPQMPLTGCWFSRWSLEVAAEDRGRIGAPINRRIWSVLLWLILFYITTMGSGSLTKLRCFA